MAEQYLINDTTLTSIADAIREKWGAGEEIATKYLPKEMPRAIRGMYGGEKVGIEDLVMRNYTGGPSVTCVWDTKGSISSIRSCAFNYQGLDVAIASFPACTYIGRSAFYQCSTYISIFLLGSSVPELGDDYASHIFPSHTTFYVPESMVDAYISAGFSFTSYIQINSFESVFSKRCFTPSEVVEIVNTHEGS